MHSVVRMEDDVIEQYDNYNSIIESLDDQLSELDNLGQDTTDLKIELNLIKDKISSGNYKILKIYLDELQPRFNNMWKKLGMEPPQMKEMNLVDEKTILEELEKAKTARDSYETIPDKSKVKKEEKDSMDSELAKANMVGINELSWSSRLSIIEL